ncbi:MAG TPA: 5-(carboxyamino)imidazole ribonucleotide synthase [Myxococcaceae bacterium]|nr:5-(carboxyamino)imidazole ribonucleotide synthase [Myxococcaceae bacterium]
MSDRHPILPGATIGILGGGQLGRMTAMAARSLGYHVATLNPDPSCAARFVVDRCITAAFDDAARAEELARGSNVVTLEIEKVSLASLEAAARHVPVRPGREVLAIIQDRRTQKAWLQKSGFPLGPWGAADTPAQLEAEVAALGGHVFVKSRVGGYDGGGQAHLRAPSEAKQAWAALGERPVVVEQALELDAEISVLVARSPSGEVAIYPPALNHHEQRILAWSVLPAPIDSSLAEKASALAHEIARRIDVVGLLVVEMFHTRDGRLYVNELAPRPHNSFHATEVACLTSQFEQVVRAVCDLPLGSAEVVRPAAIANVLGDLWERGEPRWDRALAIPGVRLHLYGKRVARPRRKMGHLSASGATPDEAVRRVREAEAALR